MTDGEFKRILLPQYRQMYATAFAILRDPDDASDAVQDTISALWQKHKRMVVPENVGAFCNRTIRNHCIDRIRQNSNRFFDRITSLYLMIPSDTSTDSEASFTSTSSLIMKYLAQLNERYRKVLTLSIFSQLSNNEISDATGESPENVRVILSRGRKTIKEFLKNEK
ncbi:MAG: sigma-70 family RNA polymerase sigma factor [Muribaculaceae bacterium]|nr:sigma-70 family RNA polymerase sigma factor [Muribaculaceae bacterium]